MFSSYSLLFLQTCILTLSDLFAFQINSKCNHQFQLTSLNKREANIPMRIGSRAEQPRQLEWGMDPNQLGQQTSLPGSLVVTQ
jgi:hypothetical protein